MRWWGPPAVSECWCQNGCREASAVRWLRIQSQARANRLAGGRYAMGSTWVGSGGVRRHTGAILGGQPGVRWVRRGSSRVESDLAGGSSESTWVGSDESEGSDPTGFEGTQAMC